MSESDKEPLEMNEIYELAKKLNSLLSKAGVGRTSTAIAILEIAKMLQTRRASSYDVAAGQHLRINGDTDEE